MCACVYVCVCACFVKLLKSDHESSPQVGFRCSDERWMKRGDLIHIFKTGEAV